MSNVITWLIVGIVSLSLLVSIASGIGFIIYITKSSRQARKQRKLDKIEQDKKDAELFKMFKAELKKREVINNEQEKS